MPEERIIDPTKGATKDALASLNTTHTHTTPQSYTRPVTEAPSFCEL